MFCKCVSYLYVLVCRLVSILIAKLTQATVGPIKSYKMAKRPEKARKSNFLAGYIHGPKSTMQLVSNLVKFDLEHSLGMDNKWKAFFFPVGKGLGQWKVQNI